MNVDRRTFLLQAAATVGIAVSRSPAGGIAASGRGPMLLATEQRLVFGAGHRTYRIDSVSRQVERLSSAGDVLWRIGGLETGSGSLNWPVALLELPDGRLVVADAGEARLQVFDLSGRHLARWPIAAAQGACSIRDLARDVRGSLYACDAAVHRVRVLDARGRETVSIGRTGTAAGELNGPCSIAIDPARRLHVLSAGNRRIDVFASTGQWLGSYGSLADGLRGPGAIAFGPDGALYVADPAAECLHVFDGLGRLAGRVTLELPDGRRAAPRHLTAAAGAILHVTCSAGFQGRRAVA